MKINRGFACMRERRFKLLFFCSLLSLSVFFSGPCFAGGKALSTFDEFISAPSENTWDAFEKAVLAKRFGTRNILFAQVLEYHEARMHRDLPNSMTLVGITPNEYIRIQERRVEAAFALIKKKQSADLWKLLSALVMQDFAEELMGTALEIAARISPAEFEKLATKALKVRPDYDWMIAGIRELWTCEKKKTGQ